MHPQPKYNILGRFEDSAGRFNFMYLAMGCRTTRVELIHENHVHLSCMTKEDMIQIMDYGLQTAGLIELKVRRETDAD